MYYAQMGANPNDVAATIAMRTAALNGAQVDTWRAAAQHAGNRNGVSLWPAYSSC